MKILKKYNQYIKGTFTEEEMETFTREIVVDHFEKEKLQNKWNRILQDEQNIQDSAKKSKGIFSIGPSKRYLRIALSAAASILLLTLCWFTFQTNSSSTYERLLSEEFNKPYIETLSRKGNVEELRLQAVAAYNSREYATAIRYFEQLSEIDEAVDWDFYIGLCHLYQKHSDLAINSFTALLKHPNKKYIVETNWYLGLAYTINEDFELAKEHIEAVANRSNDEMAWKVKEAKELLSALAEK